MTNAPERIWAQDAEPSECDYIGGGWWDVACESVQYPHVVEYVRADLCPLPEVVEKMRKALEHSLDVLISYGIAEGRNQIRAALAALEESK